MKQKRFVIKYICLMLVCMLLGSCAAAFAEEIGSDPIVIPPAPEQEKVASDPVTVPTPGATVGSEPVSVPTPGEKVESDPVVLPAPAASAEEPAAPAEEAQEPAKPDEGTDAPTEEPAEEDEQETAANTVPLKINKISMTASSADPQPGETVKVTVKLTAKNKEGAKLTSFTVTVSASGSYSVRREYEGATVKNGEVYYKGAPLSIEFECVPLTEELTFSSVRVTVTDAKETSKKLGSAKLNFGEAPAEELPEAEEPAEEIPEVEEPAEEIPEVEEPAEEIPEAEEPAEEIPEAEEPAEEIPEAEEPAEEIPEAEEPAEEIPEAEEPAEELPEVEEPAEEVPEAEEPTEELPEVEETTEEPIEEELIEELPEEAAPASPAEPQVVLRMETDKDPSTLLDGDSITLIAVIQGLQEGTYTVRWQVRQGDAWVDIEGADGTEYTLIYSPAMKGVSYRFIVSEIEAPAAEEDAPETDPAEAAPAAEEPAQEPAPEAVPEVKAEEPAAEPEDVTVAE